MTKRNCARMCVTECVKNTREPKRKKKKGKGKGRISKKKCGLQVSDQRVSNKGDVPSSSEGSSGQRLTCPWGPRALPHGTSPNVSAQACASGRHPRLMPPRSHSSAATPRVLYVSDSLRPLSQLPTYDSENQPARCGSLVSYGPAQERARKACPQRNVRHHRWSRQMRRKPFDHGGAPLRPQPSAEEGNSRARRGNVNSHRARMHRRLRDSHRTSS